MIRRTLAAFTAELRQVLRRYRRSVIGMSLVAVLALTAFGFFTAGIFIALMTAVGAAGAAIITAFILAAAAAVAWMIARRPTRPVVPVAPVAYPPPRRATAEAELAASLVEAFVLAREVGKSMRSGSSGEK